MIFKELKFMAPQSKSGLGRRIIDVSRLHTHRHTDHTHTHTHTHNRWDASERVTCSSHKTHKKTPEKNIMLSAGLEPLIPEIHLQGSATGKIPDTWKPKFISQNLCNYYIYV